MIIWNVTYVVKFCTWNIFLSKLRLNLFKLPKIPSDGGVQKACVVNVCFIRKGNLFPGPEILPLFFFFFNTMEVMNAYNKMKKKMGLLYLTLPSGKGYNSAKSSCCGSFGG